MNKFLMFSSLCLSIIVLVQGETAGNVQNETTYEQVTFHQNRKHSRSSSAPIYSNPDQKLWIGAPFYADSGTAQNLCSLTSIVSLSDCYSNDCLKGLGAGHCLDIFDDPLSQDIDIYSAIDGSVIGVVENLTDADWREMDGMLSSIFDQEAAKAAFLHVMEMGDISDYAYVPPFQLKKYDALQRIGAYSGLTNMLFFDENPESTAANPLNSWAGLPKFPNDFMLDGDCSGPAFLTEFAGCGLVTGMVTGIKFQGGGADPTDEMNYFILFSDIELLSFELGFDVPWTVVDDYKSYCEQLAAANSKADGSDKKEETGNHEEFKELEDEKEELMIVVIVESILLLFGGCCGLYFLCKKKDIYQKLHVFYETRTGKN